MWSFFIKDTRVYVASIISLFTCLLWNSCWWDTVTRLGSKPLKFQSAPQQSSLQMYVFWGTQTSHHPFWVFIFLFYSSKLLLWWYSCANPHLPTLAFFLLFAFIWGVGGLRALLLYLCRWTRQRLRKYRWRMSWRTTNWQSIYRSFKRTASL